MLTQSSGGKTFVLIAAEQTIATTIDLSATTSAQIQAN